MAFTVLYRTGFYNYTLSGKNKAGMVATFSGNRTVKVCDHRSIPIGLFVTDLDPLPYENQTPNYSTVTVAVGQGEYQTDLYEKGHQPYEINDVLYCSKNGKVTNEPKYQGGIIIGIVNFVEENLIGFITCFSRGLETFPADVEPLRQRRISRYSIAKTGGEIIEP